jgi:hypothetical protein
MYMNDYILQISTTIFAASLTALGGVVATWVAERFRRQRREKEAELDKIALAARSSDEVEIQGISADIFRNSETTHPRHAETTHAAVGIQGLVQPRSADAVEALISGYHEQALSQARAQFWFSVVAATAGFIWILYAATDIRPDNIASVLKTTPGVVMDAVAFLFFRQASETRQRATDLYDRLRQDKQAAASVELVSSIEDNRVRSAVKAQIALHMAGLDPNPIDLSNFLSSNVSHEPKSH